MEGIRISTEPINNHYIKHDFLKIKVILGEEIENYVQFSSHDIYDT